MTLHGGVFFGQYLHKILQELSLLLSGSSAQMEDPRHLDHENRAVRPGRDADGRALVGRAGIGVAEILSGLDRADDAAASERVLVDRVHAAGQHDPQLRDLLSFGDDLAAARIGALLRLKAFEQRFQLLIRDARKQRRAADGFHLFQNSSSP